MLFGKKDKKPSDRVLDLKARVDAMRAADETRRQKPYSLEHFLEGDDVLTGRIVEDDYTPQGFDPAMPRDGHSSGPEEHFEVNLQAELDKYLQRQAELERASQNERPPEAPQVQPGNETSAWALDDSWRRDRDPLQDSAAAPSESGELWPGEETNWSAPAEPPPAAPDVAAPPARPDRRQWPSEDDWPSEQTAV
jgi:hypothetical protein